MGNGEVEKVDDLRLTTCDFRLTTCDFRLTTCDFRLMVDGVTRKSVTGNGDATYGRLWLFWLSGVMSNEHFIEKESVVAHGKVYETFKVS